MISCIHQGEKQSMKIKYLGKPAKDIYACSDCVAVITSSDLCEVIL